MQLNTQGYNGLSGEFPYPIIADPKRELASQLGMIDPDEKDKAGLPVTCRAVSTCYVQPLATCDYFSQRYSSLHLTRSSNSPSFIQQLLVVILSQFK